ncbi:MAG: FadR family transcriptional regulator [Methylobacteriaceae bacterium]|jgi:GntR family transcriptional repressor for pyruvate dehydrogenase complex|nr:FadR family transcriptional regulator [Methylobacteriaceae bacterium]
MSWNINADKINHLTLYEQIADSLEEVMFGRHSDDNRLPSEYELMEQYGVSRSVIREALKILKERGLVSMRAGDGSYATIPDATIISRTLSRVTRFNRVSDAKIARVRLILEAESAVEAAVNATDDDIADLEAINEQMNLHRNDLEKRADLDCEFHRAIARISRNELLEYMIESIFELLKDYMIKRLRQYPAGNEHGIIWHGKIINAIRKRDGNLAKRCMIHHVTASFHQAERGESSFSSAGGRAEK